MKKGIKALSALLSIICVFVFSGIYYISSEVPDTVYTTSPDVVINNDCINCITSNNNENSKYYELKLLNIFPVKNIELISAKSNQVALSGEQFGVKLYASGSVITSVSSVLTAEGCSNPAYDAGLRKGDVIISINGHDICSNSDVESIVSNSESKLSIVYERNGKRYSTTAYSVKSISDGKNRLGIWIKDSIAGVGTSTFYNPANGITAGLGHGIYENETDVLMPLNEGIICDVELCGISESKEGCIGEISARLSDENNEYVIENCDCGIYSSGREKTGRLIDVANVTEIKTGYAQLYLSIDGNPPELYDCEIKSVDYKSEYKNLIVEITDDELLQKTGGIVQGMSGTPIIQNGKLVAALTHVFVNDCKKGYAVFAMTMLVETEQLSEKLN